MSRQYSNDHTPSDNSSRRFHQSSQNDFSYFQYPPHREINNLPLSRITVRNLLFNNYIRINFYLRLQQQLQHQLHIIISKIHLQLHLLVIHHGLIMIIGKIIIEQHHDHLIIIIIQNVNDHQLRRQQPPILNWIIIITRNENVQDRMKINENNNIIIRKN